jgi:galactoside O-acetyltransferase
MPFDYASLAYCGTDVRIADSVVIKHPHLVTIGDHVAIDDFCYITVSLDLGDYVHIGPHCSIIGGASARCTMDHFSGLSAGCRLVCASDDYLGSGLTNPIIPTPYRATVRNEPIRIQKHVVLGTNCVVHPGVTIEVGAAVGSCSLVTKNLTSWTIYVGIPARARGSRDCRRILDGEAKLRNVGMP